MRNNNASINATRRAGLRTGNNHIAPAPVTVYVGAGPTSLPRTLHGLAPVAHPEPSAVDPTAAKVAAAKAAAAQRQLVAQRRRNQRAAHKAAKAAAKPAVPVVAPAAPAAPQPAPRKSRSAAAKARDAAYQRAMRAARKLPVPEKKGTSQTGTVVGLPNPKACAPYSFARYTFATGRWTVHTARSVFGL